MKVIRSRDNAFVKQLIQLAHSSRERKKVGLTVLDGIHLVRAYIDAIGAPRAIAVAESALNLPEIAAWLPTIEAKFPHTIINVLSAPLIVEASSLDSPATVLAEVETPQPRATPFDASAVLVLEDVQDPGNVGSMLRSAAAAGVAEVVLSKSCAFAWSPKVLRAAQGAHFLLNIVEGADVIEFVRQYQGQSLAFVPVASKVAGATAKNFYDCKLTNATAFLIGNEGAGLSPQLLHVASVGVTVPMPGKVESLNAAACAAIAMFEMVRQRLLASS
jgi:RNA methyltransferase, TrmH family